MYVGAWDEEVSSSVIKFLSGLHGILEFQFCLVPQGPAIVIEKSYHCKIVVLFSPQDSSSVIQFMTRAKVKVDPALRVVEIANGNPEEIAVSQPPLGQPSQRVRESG